MKPIRFFSLLLLSLFAATLFASGQNLREEFALMPEKSGGVYYAYAFDNPVATLAPKGYEPFYISHYGRHGSRWLLHDGEYEAVMKVFDEADAANAFTDRGREVFGRVKTVYEDGIDRGGDLTPLGAVQHAQIAERMFFNYPGIFSEGAHVDAQATVVVRCVLSMAAFCERLKELNPQLDIKRVAGRRTTRYLNFYNKATNPNLSKNYLDFIDRGEWQKDYEKLEEQLVKPERLMGELFADSDFVKTIDARKLMLGLFYFAADMQDVDLKISFYDLFTPEELYRLNVYDNYKFYVIRGPSPLNEQYPIYYAKPLLEDILARADRAVAGGDVSADLRFGHDGNLMTLVTLMQFDGYDTVESDPEKIAAVWPLFKISPMAANIQLVFYRNADTGDVLVKFLLNEHEVRIPLKSEAAPYYKWNEVRDFYHARMEKLTDPDQQ